MSKLIERFYSNRLSSSLVSRLFLKKLSALITVGIVLVTSTSHLAFADDDGTHLIKVFPLTGHRISSKFGNRYHPIKKYTRKHTGVDLAAPSSAHIRTVAAGKVVFAGRHGSYGKLVTVLHEDDYSSLYGHLDEILVNVGDVLKAGQIVGRLGTTGASTGPHLHFEWRRSGVPLNPMKVLPELADKSEG